MECIYINIKFILEKDWIYSFHIGEWNHNHPVELVYGNAHSNGLTQNEIKSIKKQQSCCYIIDTNCTNIYNLPFDCITCIDSEAKSQLLAFSLLKN